MRTLNSARVKAQFLVWGEWFKAEKPIFQLGCAAVLLGYFLSHISFVYNAFSLTPNSVFLFHLWRPITAAFMETNPVLIAWSILALHQLIHIIEPVWSFTEVVKFSLITQFISSALISLLGLLLFALFQSLNFFYYANINGIAALSAGALISIKQFLPDTVIFTTTKGRLKNTHLPLTALFVLLILSAFGLVRFSAVIQCAIGIQVSWVYLRFFQHNKVNNCKGDDSEHFAWTTIFPRIVRPLTTAIGNCTYRLLVNLKLLKKVENVVLPSVVEQSTIELDEDSAANRKRQIALRELQTRLMQQQKQRGNQATQQNRAASLEPVVEHNEPSTERLTPRGVSPSRASPSLREVIDLS